MPNLRKLSLGVRVPPTDDQSIRLLTRLRELEQLNLHLAHLIDEPIDDDAQAPIDLQVQNSLPDFQTSYTVCEILANCPSVKSLRLKNLPLIRRRSNRSWFVKPEVQSAANRPAEGQMVDVDRFELQDPEQVGVFGHLIDQFLEQRLVMDAFDDPIGADNPNLFEAEEQRFVMAQLQQLLHESTADAAIASSLQSLHVRLDEPRLDCHYRHALEAVLRTLCRYRHLRSLQLINVRDRFVCPLTVARLVTACAQLQRLEIGSGRCVSVEVLHVFADRAQKHPNRRYELKMARTSEDAPTLHHSIFPPNLVLI
jgi:hypothetical protein